MRVVKNYDVSFWCGAGGCSAPRWPDPVFFPGIAQFPWQMSDENTPTAIELDQWNHFTHKQHNRS
jgi:hypothetical protein